MNKYEYKKMNKEPIEIEYIEDEHDETRDYTPSFWYWNRRYYLDDFTRCHNNPWFFDDDIPEYIHAVESEEYYNPIFIELIGDETINVYEYKELEG